MAAGGFPLDETRRGWITLWDTRSWQRAGYTLVDGMRVRRMAFSPDSKSLVAGGDGSPIGDDTSHRLIVFDIPLGPRHTLFALPHGNLPPSLPVFSRQFGLMAMTSPDGVMIWDTKTWNQVQTLYETRDQDYELATVPPKNKAVFDSWLFAMSRYGIVQEIGPSGVVDFMRARPERWSFNRVRGVSRPWYAKHLACTADGNVAAFCAVEEDGSSRIDLYDIVQNEQRWRTRASINLGKEEYHLIYCLSFSGDGRALAAGCARPVIRLWDVATLRELTALKGHTGAVASLAFSLDGEWLASTGNDDQTVRIWSARAPKR